jgi:hypothetical protein
MKSNTRRKERKSKMLLSNLIQKKAVLQFSKILQYHWETGKPIDANLYSIIEMMYGAQAIV